MQALAYILPIIGLGAGILAWFTQARGRFALVLLGGELFAILLAMSGG